MDASWRRFGRRALLAAGLLAGMAPVVAPALARDGQDADGRHWVATWQGSPQTGDPLLANLVPPPPSYADQTLREIVHVSLGGPQLRLRLTNSYGAQTLVVGAVHVARAAEGSGIRPGTDRPVTFAGQPGASIPPGAVLVSDPVDLAVPALSDLAVSLYVPQDTGPATQHTLGVQTSYVTAGDATGAESFPPDAATILTRPFLSNVEVLGTPQSYAVVTLGDSITDGYNSTVDANARWPDQLARRLRAQYGNRVAVSNAGISGNRVLHDAIGPNALARFDRDVLVQAGARFVTVLEGINDIGFSVALAPAEAVTAEQIIAGYRQLIARAHDQGLTIYGCTLTPFQGAGYYSEAGEAKRQAVNAFIRGGGFDGVIDFDKAVRDPQNPAMLLAAYDSGDHLHPSDAGYAAMAAAIDLSLFDPKAAVREAAAQAAE
ncbi:SGNH/GDSL hydrolase family protein [Dankookia rubra]|uniref:SGNH/GDSL hydrolase family protein n=1 Tax=Dankookia rubra TaxID=1442381 RepID=A0A4R5QEX9_9PROT|nr:SGNH/GDSL hydrolase family protein [Dankookia rubra]TDH61433.1 SGNH/GDSL hydrolase family protein [Dankookia rubra]